MIRVLGIDPGINGALALISIEGQGRAFRIADLPTFGEGAKLRVNAAALRDIIRSWGPHHAFIELVGAMPSIPGADGVRRGMGAASAFKFGRGCGAIEATVQCCDVPSTFITPQVWKKFYGLHGGDKEPSRQMAIQRFPPAAPHLTRKMDHQRAEALLIAAYGAMVLEARAKQAA